LAALAGFIGETLCVAAAEGNKAFKFTPRFGAAVAVQFNRSFK
jgi:hypothetical protein